MPGLITPISGAALSAPISAPGASRGEKGFGDVLSEAIRSVETTGQNAGDSVERFLSGESGEDLHTTVLATQRAELSFELFMQMRNKVVSAYQEIMRMQM
jgi:flagellar hook-basal body complex protein FliE